jgi:ribosomal protein L37AE/L43A
VIVRRVELVAPVPRRFCFFIDEVAVANSKTVGDATEAIVLAHLVRRGEVVLLPFGDNQRYDMVVHKRSGEFERIQCKTAKLKNGVLKFWSCSNNGFTFEKKTYAGQADVFMVHCPDNDKIYRVPVSEANQKVVSLRVDDPKINSPTVRWAAQYEC